MTNTLSPSPQKNSSKRFKTSASNKTNPVIQITIIHDCCLTFSLIVIVTAGNIWTFKKTMLWVNN